jgi:hypothetical protein
MSDVSAEQKLREAIARQIERETFLRRMQIERCNALAVQAIKDTFERITDPLENTGVSSVSVDAPLVQLETVFNHPDVCEILDACKQNGMSIKLRLSYGEEFKCTFSVCDRHVTISHCDMTYKKNPSR